MLPIFFAGGGGEESSNSDNIKKIQGYYSKKACSAVCENGNTIAFVTLMAKQRYF
jgi:hypothetical protein